MKRLLGAAALAASAAVLAQDWTATPGAAAAAATAPVGWQCQQTVALAAPAAQAAVCRLTGDKADGRLHLLRIERLDGRPPQVSDLSSLGDASAAALRLFTPPPDCGAGAACAHSLLLVDQRDESSCYGTQVWLLAGERTPRSLGFIDEVRAADGALACVGSLARVRAVDGALLITLPGPLARMGRDGTPQAVPAAEVQYRVTGAPPRLRRQPLRRAAQ